MFLGLWSAKRQMSRTIMNALEPIVVHYEEVFIVSAETGNYQILSTWSIARKSCATINPLLQLRRIMAHSPESGFAKE